MIDFIVFFLYIYTAAIILTIILLGFYDVMKTIAHAIMELFPGPDLKPIEDESKRHAKVRKQVAQKIQMLSDKLKEQQND